MFNFTLLRAMQISTVFNSKTHYACQVFFSFSEYSGVLQAGILGTKKKKNMLKMKVLNPL